MRDWMRDPNRRYPPTPYPPRTPATTDYRRGWDRGYERAKAIGPLKACRELADTYPDHTTPYAHGLQHGIAAWADRLTKHEAGEEASRRRAAAQARAERRHAAADEQPY